MYVFDIGPYGSAILPHNLYNSKKKINPGATSSDSSFVLYKEYCNFKIYYSQVYFNTDRFCQLR